MGVFSRVSRRATIAAAAVVLGAPPAGAQGVMGGPVDRPGALGLNPALRVSFLGATARALGEADAIARGLDPGVRGAVVLTLTPGGAGARSGLRAGDIITAVDGRPVGPDSDVRALIADAQPTVELTLTVIRNGEEQTIDVSLLAPAS